MSNGPFHHIYKFRKEHKWLKVLLTTGLFHVPYNIQKKFIVTLEYLEIYKVQKII